MIEMILIIRKGKLRFDGGLSAYRDVLEMLRYAGKIEILEIREDEDYLTVEFECLNDKWAKEFLIPRCRARSVPIYTKEEWVLRDIENRADKQDDWIKERYRKLSPEEVKKLCGEVCGDKSG
ncbi:hypothetical protein DRN69_00020 [Candidatus Pacearchaeota archaeon]|nr:MAG: hypothetical protein DRN69_00020 [Candidatus Pacearchaeota archaeon]